MKGIWNCQLAVGWSRRFLCSWLLTIDRYMDWYGSWWLVEGHCRWWWRSQTQVMVILKSIEFSMTTGKTHELHISFLVMFANQSTAQVTLTIVKIFPMSTKQSIRLTRCYRSTFPLSHLSAKYWSKTKSHQKIMCKKKKKKDWKYEEIAAAMSVQRYNGAFSTRKNNSLICASRRLKCSSLVWSCLKLDSWNLAWNFI